MNAKVILLYFVSALTASAADPLAELKSTMRTPIQVTQSERLQALLAPKKDLSVIALGRSDFVFSGPLVYGFRRLPYKEDLTRAQRFLRLPVIRLFVPGPMERPPETGGKYFAWRSDPCSLPWTMAASRLPVTKGSEIAPAVLSGSETAKGILTLQSGKH